MDIWFELSKRIVSIKKKLLEYSVSFCKFGHSILMDDNLVFDHDRMTIVYSLKTTKKIISSRRNLRFDIWWLLNVFVTKIGSSTMFSCIVVVLVSAIGFERKNFGNITAASSTVISEAVFANFNVSGIQQYTIYICNCVINSFIIFT